MWTKRAATIEKLYTYAGNALKWIGKESSSYKRASLNLDTGFGVSSGMGKLSVRQVVSPGGSSLATGIAAASNVAVLAATTLTTSWQTITSFVAQPDVPRCLRIVCTKTGATAVGNNALVGAANSRFVVAVGTDINGRTIIEWIQCNDTSTVDSIQLFASVTAVYMPPRVNTDGGDTISIGYGLTFAFERPLQSSVDLIEFMRKATAATSYTSEALPTLTNLIGNAYSQLTTELPALATIPTATSSVIISTTPGVNVVGSFPNGAQNTLAALIAPNGTIEWLKVTSRTTNTLTVVRGVNQIYSGGTFAAPRWPVGSVIAFRPAQGFTTTITANDRLALAYKSGVI